MGFFDKFVDTWTDWDFEWDKFTGALGRAKNDVVSAAKSFYGGASTLMQMSFDDQVTFGSVWDQYRKGVSQAGGAVGNFFGAVTQVPVLRQVFGTADWLQTETVRRPLATAGLMSGDVYTGGTDLTRLFDPERWRKAYNTTTYVTPGQAYTYAALAQMSATPFNNKRNLDEVQRRDLLRANPTLGILAQSPETLDPRNKEQRKQYYSNTFLKSMSGTLDLGTVVFLDPTIALGKVGVLAKTRFLSKEMNAAAMQKGRHLDYTEGKGYLFSDSGYQKTKDWIGQQKNAQVVQRTIFNNKYNGDTAAELLWQARQLQEPFEDAGGIVDLYDEVWRAMYGDEQAWLRLSEAAPALADVVGTKAANYTIANAARNAGLGDAVVDAQWQALKETKRQAFVDSMTMDEYGKAKGLWGQLAGSSMLVDQAVPRLRATSKWRSGVHTWLRNAPPVVAGIWHALPTSRTAKMADLNDVNSVRRLRTWLEHSRLSQDQVDNLVGAYARATSSESRFAVYNTAENAGLTAHAERHGFTKGQVDSLLPQLRKMRSANRRLMAGARSFASDDVRKAYEQLRAEAQEEMARGNAFRSRLKESAADAKLAEADTIVAAVARGERPAAIYHWTDEDGTYSQIPEDSFGTTPITQSQHADVVSLVDWDVLDNALWWQAKGIGKKTNKEGVEQYDISELGWGSTVYKYTDGVRALLDTAMSVWKASAILRPGYVWRALSDETGRVIAKIGSGQTMATIGNSAGNVAWNMWGRFGGPISSRMAQRRTARQASATTTMDVDAEVVAEGAKLSTPGTLPPDADLFWLTAPDLGRSKPAAAPLQAAPPTLTAPTAAPTSDFGTRVVDAFESIVGTGGNYLSLAKLWARFPEMSKEQFEEALTAYVRKNREAVGLLPESNQKTLTEADRAAEVIFGNQRRNLLWVPNPVEYLAARTRPAPVAAPAPEPPAPPVAPAAPPTNYMSYEQALADGLLGVDDFMERVYAHGYVGTLPPQLSEIYHAYQAGSLTERAYQRQVVRYALSAVGRGVYTEPAAQFAMIDLIVRAHKGKKAGTPGALIVVDVNTGQSPKIRSSEIADKFTLSRPFIMSPDGEGYFNNDDIFDFIADNVDELLMPGRLLHGYVRPDGRINLAVATVIDPKMPVKPSAGKRIKVPFGKMTDKLYRDSGSAGFAIHTTSGPVYLRGAFEGQEGDLTRRQVSSRGVADAWAEVQTDLEHARLMAMQGRWTNVEYAKDPRAYAIDYKRAVNQHLSPDPVARMFLEGKSRQDVMSWIRNSKQGRAYQHKMGPWRSHYAEKVMEVEAMVKVYAPIRGDVPTAAETALREQILKGDASVNDLFRVVSKDDAPLIHGLSVENATLSGPVINWLRKRTDSTFKWLSDIPNDKFARMPFAAERYRLHATELAKARGGQLAKAQKTFSAEDILRLEREARSRSLADVQRYLYDNVATLDLAKLLRLFIPFGSAIADSTFKWGVVMREKPWVALQLWKLWSAPERAGLVQDEEGNHLQLEDGHEVWYSVHPETGERTRLDEHVPKQKMITFRLPSWIAPSSLGEYRPTVGVNKEVFHTMLDMPTFGPIVSVPANNFALKHPEFAENKFVREFVLPFGGYGNSTIVGVPGNVRNLREWILGDKQYTEAQAGTIFAAEATNHALGLRPNMPTFAEARSKANMMRHIRFLSRFGGVSSQFSSPYQPYVDYHRMLETQEFELRKQAALENRSQGEIPSADQRFYEEMGPEYFALTVSVTKNVMGIPSTLAAHREQKRSKDLIEKFPDLAPLIIGAEGAGAFNKTVYELQKITPKRFGSDDMMREKLPLEDQWKDVQRRKGWIEYGKFMDGVHADMFRLRVNSLSQKGAASIKAAREKWIADRMFVQGPYGVREINPWFEEFKTFDTSKMTSRLDQMRQIIRDDRLQGRNDIQGLVAYLDYRERFKSVMKQRKYKTLDSRQGKRLKGEWDRVVFNLKQGNLAFSSLYDRWLSNDEYLEAV